MKLIVVIPVRFLCQARTSSRAQIFVVVVLLVSYIQDKETRYTRKSEAMVFYIPTGGDFSMVRSIFSFHVEMVFLLDEPKASLVTKRSKHEN